MNRDDLKTVFSLPLIVRLSLLGALLILIIPYTGIFGGQTPAIEEDAPDELDIEDSDVDTEHTDEGDGQDAAPLPDDFDEVLKRGDHGSN